MNYIIYKAENLINGHVYIGKTTKSLISRKSSHKSIALKSKQNTYFHRAIRKYGWDNFEWSILCETGSESKLNALEKFYISAYRKMTSCYNMTDGGEGATGYNPPTETRLRISKSLIGNKRTLGYNPSPETRKKFSEMFSGEGNPNFGKHHSEETRKKISESKKGKTSWNKGIPCSNETKIKLSNSNKNRPSGENHYLYGKRRDPEMIERMRLKLKGRKIPEDVIKKRLETRRKNMAVKHA